MTALFEELPVADGLKALVRAGGSPYILLSVVDEATGQVELISQGFRPEQIVAGLREAADLVADELGEEA